ncbi:MAG: hypothetical protein IPL61_14770 [Myxococcales bacterium]|nr:hypothetical protein [Myxococcales bacterium]
MRIECPACHTVTDATVARSDDDTITVACGACGHAEQAPTLAPTLAPTPAPTPAPTLTPTPAPTAAPTPAPTLTPTPAPTLAPTPAPTAATAASAPASEASEAQAATGDAQPRCPKCDTPRREGGPCPRCGLAPEHAAAWRPRPIEAPTEALGAAWAVCTATWSDLDAHERAATVALATRDFAWLAARYRDRIRTDGADPIASAQLDKLARRAQAALAATAVPSTTARPGRRVPVVAIVVAVVALAATGLYAAHLAQTRSAGTGRRRPVEPAVDTRPRPLPDATIEPAAPRR